MRKVSGPRTFSLMMSRLLFLFALCSSTAFAVLGCCGAAPPAAGTPTSTTTASTTSSTTTAMTTSSTSPPALGNCGHGPYATTCGAGQTCCAGGMAESYYCASLQPGGMCPPLP